MNKLFFAISILLITNNIFAQKIIFEEVYSNLPFELKMDNSGIYSIASFDVLDEVISFSSFTKAGIYEFKNGKYLLESKLHKSGYDFIVGANIRNNILQKNISDTKDKGNSIFRKNFLNEKSVLKDNNGVITGTNGERITIAVPNKNELVINSNIAKIKNEMLFHFPNNLACANLIGIDKLGNTFVVVEKYISEIPLKVNREVYTISKSGNIISRLLLPNIKYLFTLKDLQIDGDGNLYHLLSYPDKVQIVKWDDLTTPTKGTIKYSDKYNLEIHFNNYTPTDEIKTVVPKNIRNIKGSVSRTKALRIADTYVLHQYNCSSSNLAPSNVTAPDGDIVRTPGWLIEGVNARIPYKWGGFNTLAQFDAGLKNGKYAGDINTDGVSSYAVGVDCSGFVSRCWQMSYHASTRGMPSITTQYGSWEDLKPGDAVHRIGHVRLFVERNINGTIKVVESTGRGWGVSYYSYTASDLSDYSPRYYNNMEDNFNSERPILVSAKLESENIVALNWNCDTVGVLGYRVYSSVDGNVWNKILDENSCTVTNTKVVKSSSVNYYRVSSVANDSPNFSESNWSNVLGVSSSTSEKRALIVDGFERESGSWRGAGHTFVLKYGKALEALSINFNTVKNSELQNGQFQLGDYDYVFWILGDESTIDETFNSTEQSLVEKYLENGGSLFISGSEIGWDLDHRGSEKDKDFYGNYLKANYLSDDAGKPILANGLSSSSLDGCSIIFGQTYDEDYPDEIEAVKGSRLCMKYSNGKGAGVEYNGEFGNTNLTGTKGNLIYLAFPLETTANDTSFNKIILKAVTFFVNNPTSVKSNTQIISEFKLEQNYPNPFNPTTAIRYEIPKEGFVDVKIYNSLGQEVATLVSKKQNAGNYIVEFDASSLSSGVYFYKLVSGNNLSIKKMLLLK